MSQKFIKSLSTLLKVEDGNIKALQPTIADLNQKITDFDQKIKALDLLVVEQKKFLHESHSLDYINFLDRINNEKRSLEDKKKPLQKQYDQVFEKMMAHVIKEKSYKNLKEKTMTQLKKDDDKKESDTIEDILMMRHHKV